MSRQIRQPCARTAPAVNHQAGNHGPRSKQAVACCARTLGGIRRLRARVRIGRETRLQAEVFSGPSRARDACRNSPEAPHICVGCQASKQGTPPDWGMLFRQGGSKARHPWAASGFLRFAHPTPKTKPSSCKACVAVCGVIGSQLYRPSPTFMDSENSNPLGRN